MIYLYDQFAQWSCVFAILALAVGFRLRKLIGAVPSITVLYFTLNGAFTWLVPTSFDTNAESRAAADSVGKILLVFGGMLFLSKSKEFERFGEYTIVGFGLLCATFAFLENGLLGNASMNACFAVITLPIAMNVFRGKAKFAASLLTVCAVFVSKSSIAIGLLGIVSLFGLGNVAWLTLPFLPAMWFAAGAELFNSSDRFKMWYFFLTNWNLSHNWLFGRGLGTFAVNAYRLQSIFHINESQLWWNPHNDWLELFLSTGIVGILLFAAMAFICFRGLQSHLKISAILFMVLMVFNFPLHSAPFAVFGMWLGLCGAGASRAYGCKILAEGTDG